MKRKGLEIDVNYQQKYYAENRDRIRKYRKERYNKNKKYWIEYYKNNKDRILTVKKEYHISKSKEHRLWCSARNRATKNNIPFNIEISDIIIPEICPVFRTPIETFHTKTNNNSPSIDRIIPSLGYVKGNVQIISWRANRIKADASIRELELVLEYVKRLEKD